MQALTFNEMLSMLTVLTGKKVTLGIMKVKKGEQDDNLLQTFGPQNPLLNEMNQNFEGIIKERLRHIL